jgi:phage baseplate assembly protein W
MSKGVKEQDAFAKATYDIQVLQGVERKTQDIVKILLTSIGSNPVYPTYGSELPNIPGKRSTDATNDLILESIIKALGFVQAIETSIRPDERVKRIMSLYVEPGKDPRVKIIRLLVEMENGSIADTSVPMSTEV